MTLPPPFGGPTLLEDYRDLLAEALTRLCGSLPAALLDELLGRIAPVRVRVGETLYRQGESGEQLHIVLTGRLQVRVRAVDGSERVVAYPQPGDVVGEMALFSGSGRAATLVAMRDTLLGALHRADLDALVARHPQAFTGIAQMIIARLTGASGHIARRSGSRTVMLVPLHRGERLAGIPGQLHRALLRFGSVLTLDSRTARRRFDAAAVEDYGRQMDACEGDYDFLLLVADAEPSAWTRFCHGYADRVLLLADAEQSPSITELERWFFHGAETGNRAAATDLVLLHRPGTSPSHTRDWLDARQVGRHHHLRTGDDGDIARLARVLSNQAVALVLAGGGARGFAHLGVIRALHESGIAIDAIGGASFGALTATGVARGLDDLQSLEEQRVAFSRDDPLGDYTVPILSLVRGGHLDQILRRHLPMDIEDLWLPFFAVSSDLSANKVRVHDRGPLWQAIRASVSLPAILPPMVDNGHLLIDGGVLNNLPVDVMRERIAGRIIAVDLAVDSLRGAGQDKLPSALDYLKSRLIPGNQSLEAPTLSRIILQVTTLASRKEVDGARKQADLYLNPPLGAFDLLDWHRMREIADIGYRHALPRIREWLHQHPRHENRAGFVRAWQHTLSNRP